MLAHATSLRVCGLALDQREVDGFLTRQRLTDFVVEAITIFVGDKVSPLMYSPATQIRVSIEAVAGVVYVDRARLLVFQIGT